MVAFSKPVTLPYSCYELGHTWNPSCLKAIRGVGVVGFKESFKIYTSLYVIAAVLRKRSRKYYLKKLLPEILQSTVFLGSNAYLFVAFFCLWRKLVGFFTFYNALICGIPACAISLSFERKSRLLLGRLSFLTAAFIPACNAASVAIMFERKSRRGILALYMTNLAIETAYRMAVSRNIVQPMKYGEVLLFSVTSAVFLYLYRKKGGLSSSVASSIRLFLGSEEHGDSGGSSELEQSSEYGAQRWSIPIWRKVRKIQHWIQQGRKHILCKHNNSCISYVFQGFLNMFGIGYAIQFAVRVLSSLSRIFKQPKQLLYTFVHKDNFSLGAFLGCFSALFRTVNCVLRQLRNEDDSLNGLLSGFIAGWSMLWYKSSSIALYLASKLVEVLYFKGIENEILPYIKCADIILYSISTGFIFHAAVLEPHNLRPAYWKFLIRMTHNRFSEMNRKLMDVFGTNASKLYPDFWPDLDPQVSQLTKPL